VTADRMILLACLYDSLRLLRNSWARTVPTFDVPQPTSVSHRGKQNSTFDHFGRSKEEESF
jgi:hypothetical protein